jgi:hypothetical protein
MALDLLLRAHLWTMAALIPLLVRFLGLRHVLFLMTPPRRRRLYGSVAPECLVALVRRRLERPRVMKRRKCLREGLLLFHFLRLAGQPAVLKIGVFPPGPDGARNHAHCWITLHDAALTVPPQGEVAVLLVHPREAASLSGRPTTSGSHAPACRDLNFVS